MGLNRNAEIDAMIAESGVEIIVLREGSIQDQKRSDRKFSLISKAMEGDERSQQILNKEKEKERRLIFSPTERWRVD
jgi:hypothetical protein